MGMEREVNSVWMDAASIVDVSVVVCDVLSIEPTIRCELQNQDVGRLSKLGVSSEGSPPYNIGGENLYGPFRGLPKWG